MFLFCGCLGMTASHPLLIETMFQYLHSVRGYRRLVGFMRTLEDGRARKICPLSMSPYMYITPSTEKDMLRIMWVST